MGGENPRVNEGLHNTEKSQQEFEADQDDDKRFGQSGLFLK